MDNIDTRICKKCHCTTHQSCQNGCHWVTDDECSNCYMTEFEKRIYKICYLLGARSCLLAIIGSYKDTQTDEEIIEALDHWIDIHEGRNNKFKEDEIGFDLKDPNYYQESLKYYL